MFIASLLLLLAFEGFLLGTAISFTSYIKKIESIIIIMQSIL